MVRAVYVREYGRFFLVESRMQENFACGIRNPGLWNPELQLKEFAIPVTIGIQNPSSTDKYWNPAPGIRNPQCGIQNPRLPWIPLRGATPKCNSCFSSLFGMGLWFGYLNAYSIILSIVMRNECCSVKGLSSRMKTKPLTIFRYRKIPKISPGLIFFKGPFWGAYFWRGLYSRGLPTEGNFRFKIDWASLIVGSKFNVFALFYFVFEGKFLSTSPRGLIFGGAI